MDFGECAFLAEILVGNDGSPLTKALVDSNLGDELAPISGISNETKNFTISFGLSGVKHKNEEKVFDVIMDALKKICENGIGKKDLDEAVMSGITEKSHIEVFYIEAHSKKSGCARKKILLMCRNLLKNTF